jgi:hypothetical protein
MDYFYFALIVIGLIGIIVIISRYEKGIKTRHIKDAYGLLETSEPDLKKVIDTIKGLRLYGGRWRKDKECVQLVKRLQDKFGSQL